jgi:hypothetical protein
MFYNDDYSFSGTVESLDKDAATGTVFCNEHQRRYSFSFDCVEDVSIKEGDAVLFSLGFGRRARGMIRDDRPIAEVVTVNFIKKKGSKA